MIPTPLPLYTYVEPDAYDDHVREDCPYLSACRARASTEHWSAFSCIACTVDTTHGIDTFDVSTERVGSRPRVMLSDSEDGEPDSLLDAYFFQDSVIAWRTASWRSGGLTGRLLSKAEQRAKFGQGAPIVVGPIDDDGKHPLYEGYSRLQHLRGCGEETVEAVIVSKAACPRCMENQQLTLSIVDDLPGEVLRDGFCVKCRHVIEPVVGGLEFFNDVRSRIAETMGREAKESRAARAVQDYLRGRGKGAAA